MDVKQRLALNAIQARFIDQDAAMHQRQTRAVELQAERLELSKAITAMTREGDLDGIAAAGMLIAQIDRELRAGQ